MRDPKERFTGRAESYARHRPPYPEGVLDLLRAECGLTAEEAVADVGSGTGILSRLFLENGNPVYGVEPNGEMRRAGEAALNAYERFVSVAGSAEETTLRAGSVGFVAAGQAFHWFDRARARVEFRRILVPDGWVVLAWNERRRGGTAFMEGYEAAILALGTDYARVSHQNLRPEDFAAFYGGPYGERDFQNPQPMSLEGLRGRVLSTSYAPGPGEEGHEALMERMEELFREHEREGRVVVEYDCRVYFGRLS